MGADQGLKRKFEGIAWAKAWVDAVETERGANVLASLRVRAVPLPRTARPAAWAEED